MPGGNPVEVAPLAELKFPRAQPVADQILAKLDLMARLGLHLSDDWRLTRSLRWH
jgi:hypothetical protein